MDNLSKLQALLPDTQVAASGENSPWTHDNPPAYLHEGTDSEDDEEVMRRGKIVQNGKGHSSIPDEDAEDNYASITELMSDCQMMDHELELGQLAAEGEDFCPWQVVKKYPFAYIGVANREKVAKAFWDGGKLFDQTWDFFYLRRLKSDTNQASIFFVPTKQFTAFLTTINQTLRVQLAIPSGGGGSAFRIAFPSDGTPQPRYLGRSTTEEMANNLHSAVPPNWFKHMDEGPRNPQVPSDQSLAAFRAKMDMIAQAQKGRKTVNAEKKKGERIIKQQSWGHITKRVQRYLGLRQANAGFFQPGLAVPGSAWDTQIIPVKAGPADFNPDETAPYEQESDVVFVSVDIEANERCSSQITEIGIATLDTRDLKPLVLGEDGDNWLGAIRARHFRINEYKHIRNSEFVSGCPDRFAFGESEFIKLADAPRAVASCFKPPFSNRNEQIIVDDRAPKRNIILVGHGLGADITYLKSLGYDIHNLSNLQETVDTALMWQALKRELSPRNLGAILAEVGIAGWNLHNAGNDATYTLQAMIKISIKHLRERDQRIETRNLEKQKRVEETMKEAMLNALDREEGWSSRGEDSDGGVPIEPVAPGTKKPLIVQPKHGSQYRDGPWRRPELSEGPWRPSAASSNQPALSSHSWGHDADESEAHDRIQSTW